MIAFYYHKLTPEMYDDIALFTACEVHADAIIKVYIATQILEKYVYARNVYNSIQSLQHQNQC